MAFSHSIMVISHHMALPANKKKHRRKLNRDGELYNDIMKKNEDMVIEACEKFRDGPLEKITIHFDTVLHMATYSEQTQLVLKLLKMLPDSPIENMTLQNDVGNTVLHEAATSNGLVPAAVIMLQKSPELLRIQNEREETALFRAARYGRMEMFRFLEDEVEKIISKTEVEEAKEEIRKTHYERRDNTTVLHISILTEHFDLALYIATKHKNLVSAKDGEGMTALQLLAINPSAFEQGSKQRYLKQLINCFSSEDAPVTEEGVPTEGTPVTEQVESSHRVPLWKAIGGKNQNYKSAVRLAKFLIERDTSWEATESALDHSKPILHSYGSASLPSEGQKEEEEQKALKAQTSTIKIAKTPLFLATKSGILEIVKEILERYPQAVEYIDDEGRNILHLAIKYRQIHIFDYVEKMEIPMRRLIRKTTNNGNSILHMVGIKAEEEYTADQEDMRSPALLLQEHLLLFERVEKISTAHFTKHRNNKRDTAEKLFAVNNAKLRKDAQEWLKRTAENCSIVAVLIATVAFAAAYTIPGGPNQNTGYPLLLNKSFFVIFTMADVLSLTFALTSVITFLSILTSPFRLKDFKQSLPQKLMLGVTLLILSVSMMMLAFAATVILLIRDKEQWTKIALYFVAFLPVSIFALSYLPLYIALIKTFVYSLKKIGEAFPPFDGGLIRSWVANSFSRGKTRAPVLSNPKESEAGSSTWRSTTQYPV